MTVYVVTIDFCIPQDGPEFGCPVFDSVHGTKEAADKRCSEIMKGINLPGYTGIALSTYLDTKKSMGSKPSYYFFSAEIIPVEIEKN